MDLGSVLLGLATIAVGYNSLAKGAQHLANGVATPSRRVPPGVRVVPGSRVPTMVIPRAVTKKLPPVVKQTAKMKTLAGSMATSLYGVQNLNDRLAVIIDKAHQGKTDPQVIAWARKQVSQRKPGSTAWNGDQWVCGEKDAECELRMIHQGMRRSIRYTSDPVGADLYARPARTLAMGAGDCLPGDTELVTPKGLVAIRDVKVGDTIHDGANWVKITNWWDKGEQDVLAIGLDNRSFLRCTGGHRVFRVTRGDGEHTEERADALMETDLLLQPREFAAGMESLSPGHAIIMGAYISEGWWDATKDTFFISGIPNSKGLRELVLKAAASLGITDVYEHARYLGFRKEHAWLIDGCGKAGAAYKQLPHLNFDRPTVDLIVRAMEMGDGGVQGAAGGKGCMTYSTASATLAHQYRVLKRMQGQSTLMRCLSAEEHGGAGSLPVWRLIVRGDHKRKPWAKVDSVESIGSRHVYDIETESHRIYLPGSDVIVHNCDEYTAVACAAAMAVGRPCRMVVIETKDSKEGANHIYAEALAGGKWIPMDASVNMPFGWSAPDSMVRRRWIYETE